MAIQTVVNDDSNSNFKDIPHLPEEEIDNDFVFVPRSEKCS